MRTRLIAATVVAVLTLSNSASAQNLVTNGSFETGTFAGWTGTGNQSLNGVGCPGPGPSVTQGSCSAFFGPFGSVGGISQALATTIGTNYTFSFWTKFDGATPSSFAAIIGGNTVASLANPPAGPYTQQSYAYTATSASTTIAFNFRDDPGFEFLDDVRVVATTVAPEPSTYALMGAGLFAVGFAARRRRRV